VDATEPERHNSESPPLDSASSKSTEDGAVCGILTV